MTLSNIYKNFEFAEVPWKGYWKSSSGDSVSIVWVVFLLTDEYQQLGKHSPASAEFVSNISKRDESVGFGAGFSMHQ